MMEQEQPFLADGGVSVGRDGDNSGVISANTTASSSITTSLSLPSTFLSSVDHPITIGNCLHTQFGGHDDPPLGDYCGYSKPFLVLDVMWNLSFVFLSVFVLLITVREKPSTPLRVWIIGYALQCVFHVGLVYHKSQRRYQDDLSVQFDVHSLSQTHSRIVKKLETANTVISSIWWVVGLYWIIVGGRALLQHSPRLYWLAVVFLGFDVFFMIFCITIVCIVLFTLFCCFPVVATIAYAISIAEGASEKDIRSLPKLKFRQSHSATACVSNHLHNITTESGSRNSTPELALPPDDSECCICLHHYLDGAELCLLPCKHHFHYGCIRKWLRIKATCPLCKLNIFRGDDTFV